jgi:hypothetical protein
LESILELLKSLKIRALDFVNSVPGTAVKESRGRSVEVRELLKDQEKESAGGWEFTVHSTVQQAEGGVRRVGKDDFINHRVTTKPNQKEQKCQYPRQVCFCRQVFKNSVTVNTCRY